MLRNLRQFWFDTMEGTDRNQWTHFLHNAKRFRKKVLTKKHEIDIWHARKIVYGSLCKLVHIWSKT